MSTIIGFRCSIVLRQVFVINSFVIIIVNNENCWFKLRFLFVRDIYICASGRLVGGCPSLTVTRSCFSATRRDWKFSHIYNAFNVCCHEDGRVCYSVVAYTLPGYMNALHSGLW